MRSRLRLGNRRDSNSIVRTRFAGNQSGGCGGGIANKGTAVLTLAESEITGVNEADGAGGGLCNEATMSLTVGSEVSTNEARMGGGGVYNSGALTIRNSVVRDNSALDADEDNDGLGGGLYSVAGGTTTVTQSAIVSNNAATSGGGVVADGAFNVFNTTLSDNFGGATGGLFVMDNGSATLVNVTMADNEALLGLSGTGLHVLNGTAVIGNSIVANTTQELNTCSNASGAITSLGHNLSDDESCFGEASDLVNADPLLVSLADGVRMPQAGSPVIDAANLVNCTETAVSGVDQLGQERPLFNGCDIGAIEWAGLQVFLPTVIR